MKRLVASGVHGDDHGHGAVVVLLRFHGGVSLPWSFVEKGKEEGRTMEEA